MVWPHRRLFGGWGCGGMRSPVFAAGYIPYHPGPQVVRSSELRACHQPGCSVGLISAVVVRFTGPGHTGGV
jgi:hypothetical protein